MESIQTLFNIGTGPSSSHTMGPKKAAERFRNKNRLAKHFRVTLSGSLAATGKGHLTDKAVYDAFTPLPVEIIWKPDQFLPFHPNAMKFEALGSDGEITDTWQAYSVGGGAVREEGETVSAAPVYRLATMSDIMAECETSGMTLWQFVEKNEGDELWPFLKTVWDTMHTAVERGLATEGMLPGMLKLNRKAWTFFQKARLSGDHFKRTGIISAYALAAAEENASGGTIVTAPTCGACGVVPAVLRYLTDVTGCSENTLLRAVATAGLIGNLVRYNGSISGAEVGCQGEIGTACAMAAGAAAQLLGGSVHQIEYAAEMGLEHHLGLTCDPVGGLVQIPCIERNAFAATRALNCADYALFSDGRHQISFDEVVSVMKQTGHDLPCLYRETSSGGLAKAYSQRGKTGGC